MNSAELRASSSPLALARTIPIGEGVYPGVDTRDAIRHKYTKDDELVDNDHWKLSLASLPDCLSLVAHSCHIGSQS